MTTPNHGWSEERTPDNSEPHRIDVVTTQDDGPPDRRQLIRHLPRDEGAFNWGYNGGGPQRAANAIVADALEVATAPHGLADAFCGDVVSQLQTGFRLRRGTVLRYARGWYAEQGAEVLPLAVLNPPAVNDWDDD